MNLQRYRNLRNSDPAGIGGQKRNALSLNLNNEFNDSTGSWESFVGLWDRANLIRGYFWNSRTTGNKNLLIQCLVRLRRFFGVDFSFGALILSGEKSVEVGVPEAAMGRLPANFSRRCLDLVASSRAPISWNELNSQFGFRSTVVAPLASPLGRPFGFLMLGHSSRRSYSSAELFLLQALAGELSWAVRDLASKQQHQRQLAGLSHDVKNALQVTIGNAALIRQKLKDLPVSDHEKHIVNIESSVQEILDRLSCLVPVAIDDDDEGDAIDESAVDIAAEVTEAVDSYRETMRERGISFEVTCTPQFPGEATTDPVMFKQFLANLLGAAALCTRNETVQLAVQREASSLELAVKGLGKSRAAEKLKSLFEPAARSDGARDEFSEGVNLIKEYLKNMGGDVYLRTRPGGTSEFVVCLPIDGKDPAVQSS